MVIDYIKDLFDKDYDIVEYGSTNRFYPLYKGQFIFKNKEEYRLSTTKMGCESSKTKSDAKKLIKEYKIKKVMENI